MAPARLPGQLMGLHQRTSVFCGASFLVLLLIGLVASSCSIADRPTPQLTGVRTAQVPGLSTTSTSVTWLDNDWLIVERDNPAETATDYTSRIWRAKPDGSHLEEIPLPDYPGCVRSGFDSPERLPDGRMGYVVFCMPSEDIAVPDKLYMMAYDFETGKATALLNYPLPSVMVGTGRYSWNPQMTRGITSDGVGRYLNEHLYWFTPDRSETLDLGFHSAYGASWSPDGKRIAFMAVAPVNALFGVTPDTPLKLYLMDSNGSNVRPVLGGIRHTSGASWSPDAHWLVFAAAIGQEQGMWLFRPEANGNSGPYLLTAGRYNDVRWSPNGQRIVVLEYPNPDLASVDTSVLTIDVGPILKGLENTPTR